jgi:type I restriction enzyme, S subunit
MDVKPGYKQTEVGVIPEEWEVKPISHIVERLEAGVSVNSVDENLSSCAHSESVLKTSAVTEGCFLPHECKKIAPRDLSRVNLRPRANTIIISRMNTPALVGECGYVDKNYENLFLPDRLWMTKQRSGSEASIRWLAYLLSSKPQKDRIKELATGTSGTMKNLAKSSLLELEIAVPTPSEQRAIATALSDVDALLAALDRLIAKQRDLKQAAMQQLLTGQTRLPGFEGDWEVKRLGDVASVKDGTHQTPRYVTSGIPFYSVEHVTSGDFKNTKFISEEEHRFLTRSFKMEKGNILMTRIGSIGDCKLIDWEVDASFYVSLALLKINPGYSAAFIAHYSKSATFQKEVELHSLQSAIPKKINLGPISEVKIELPPLSEQTAIATVLTDMDAELTALEQRRDKTRALKQGMMQELLAGRTRLID